MNNCRVALITNIPSPYRVYFFNELDKVFSGQLIVFYCSITENNRQWELPIIKHKHIFLKTKKVRKNLYYTSNISRHLKTFNPDIIITAGFTPVMLRAFFFAFVNGKKHIVLTDSWGYTVEKLSVFHKLIRRFVFLNSDAYVCIGKKGKQFLMNYGCKEHDIFISPISIDVSHYKLITNRDKIFHILFSGQFIERKMPLFFCEVAIKLSKRIQNFKVLIIGSGPLEKEIKEVLDQEDVYFEAPGFIQPTDLPRFYESSKILLFPTEMDHWGVVANEACAAGVPVITGGTAGVAGDLIINGYNGLILPYQSDIWVDNLEKLLKNDCTLSKFARNAFRQRDTFKISDSITGLISSITKVSAK